MRPLSEKYYNDSITHHAVETSIMIKVQHVKCLTLSSVVQTSIWFMSIYLGL
jgi:hypothetical protein